MSDQLEVYFSKLQNAVKAKQAKDLANMISLSGRPITTLIKNQRDVRNTSTTAVLSAAQTTIRDKMWQEVGVLCWKVAYSIHIARDIVEAYKEQNALAQLINRISEKSDGWILNVIYTVTRQLRIIAIEADQHIKARETIGEKADKLEEASRTINRSFTICLNDRNQNMAKSRKWGVYFEMYLLFKIYFKLGTISLANSLLRALKASSTDMPPLSDYPKSHIVAFQYYSGVLNFLEENYEQAEEKLQSALDLCHKHALKNQELILMYLLPTCCLLHRKFPNKAIFVRFPRLEIIYNEIFLATRRGDLRSFEAALAAREHIFVTRRIYLTMLKIRSKIVRPRLFQQVYLALDKSTRIPISAFRQGLQFVGIDVDDEQIECWAAVMIYQGNMKGYISRERKIVVLSNTDPFPL
ncbi:hypothetical protein V1511DRAFT_501868 [Dipodascopsis uninucleata]